MKAFVITILFVAVFLFASAPLKAQCSICTRTAQQLGEKPAQGLNAGIIYLALTPLAIIGIIGYTWNRKNRTSSSLKFESDDDSD